MTEESDLSYQQSWITSKHIFSITSHFIPGNNKHYDQRVYLENFRHSTIRHDTPYICVTMQMKDWRVQNCFKVAASRMGCWWSDCAPWKPRDGQEQDWWGVWWPWWCPGPGWPLVWCSGPGGALVALPTRGPGLRPWLPRATSSHPAAALVVALSCAPRPRQGRHQPSPSIPVQLRERPGTLESFGSAGRSADPGYDQPAAVPDQPTKQAAKYVGAQLVFGHA